MLKDPDFTLIRETREPVDLGDVTSYNGYEQSTGGIWMPRQTRRRRGKPTGVDLFSGIGGFSLGFIQAGYEVVCAVENDPWPALTYLTNLGQWPMRIHFPRKEDEERFEACLQEHFGFKTRRGKKIKNDGKVWKSASVCGSHRPFDRTPVRSFIFGDIRDVTGDMIRWVCGEDEIDCVMGGPPCQGFSKANARRGPTDPRNPLIFEFARLITELCPATFCMENVPGIVDMLTPTGVPVLDQFLMILRDGGYDAYNAMENLRKAHPELNIDTRTEHLKKGKKKKRRKKGRSPAPRVPLPLLEGRRR